MNKVYNIFFLFIIISCSEETILYDEIENPSYTINTLTLPIDRDKVFQTQPSSLGTGTKLFFGNLKNSENLFSLVEFTLFGGTLPPIQLSDLLADSIQVDSALVFFQTSDSLESSSTLSLYSILSDQDSIFSQDSTNYYNLSDYIDFENSAQLIDEISLESIEPDTVSGYDTLSFLFKDDNLDLIKEFFDTEQHPSRTMMLKASSDLDQLLTIESKESGASYSPRLKVWYKAIVDESTTIDTFTTFFASRDLSIVKPPEIVLEDHDYISLNSASGNRSILRYDLSIIDSLERNSIIKDANITFSINSSNITEGDDFYVAIAALQDTVLNWDFTTFLPGIYEDESYEINSNFITSRKIQDDKIIIPVQAFIQLYKNDLIDNNGFQIWSAPANSPFDKVRLNAEEIEVLYVKP
tara:strand:+ start:381 stop:1613 length:1233 start_codon:yes stop_codon:yes gene_type:complete